MISHNLSKLNVCVIGLGTAGLASAIFLSKLGHRVTIYEKTGASQLSRAAGAGLGLQPIGLTVLKRLGVLERILQCGSRIDRLHALTREGKTVLDLKYADFRDKLYGIGIHRDVLFHSLYEEACTYDGVTIETGAKVKNIIENQSYNSKIVYEDGKSEGPFDLVVLADGRDSIRKNLDVKQYEKPYPFGCIWSIVEDKKCDFTENNTLFQRLDSASTMLGILPTGRSFHADPESPNLVSIFWSIETNRFADFFKEGIDSWKEKILSLEPKMEYLLNEITSIDQLIEAHYSDTYMPKLYDKNLRVAFLGDCAHATSPQLGQGANLALVDAWVLSESISRASTVQEALQMYDEKRKWRLRFYQLNSRMLTPVFQSNSKIIGSVRDIIMEPLCKFPLTRLQMLTVMCGAQNNGIPWTTIPDEEFMGYLGIQ